MDLNEYQQTARKTAIYPAKGELLGLLYCVLKLNGEAGEVAEKLGKCLRDEAGKISLERREALILELGDVLWYVANLAEELQMDLEVVAQRNLAKLADRKSRGTLQGSGDAR